MVRYSAVADNPRGDGGGAAPPTTSRHARTVLLVAGLAFAALAAGAALAGVLPADAQLREAALALGSPTVIGLLRVVNLAGDKLVLAPATLGLFVVFPSARRRWWIWVGLMIAAPTVEGLLKEVIGRPRPEGLGHGFPSGHATAAAAFFGAVLYLAGSVRPWPVRLALRAGAVTLIVLVGAARVVLRAHWPSDVLAGIALGLALASVAALLADFRGRPALARGPGPARRPGPAPPPRGPDPA